MRFLNGPFKFLNECFHQIWEVIVFSSNILFFYLSLSGSHYTWVGVFDIVSQLSETLFSFLHYFSFMLFQLYNFKWNIVKLGNFSFDISNLLISLMNFFRYYNLQLQKFNLVIFILSICLMISFIWWDRIFLLLITFIL